jgi:hypothetical protein
VTRTARRPRVLPARLWVPIHGVPVECGTAALVAATLGPDVTAAMVRRWADRGHLQAHRVGRAVYYRLDQAAAAEARAASSGRGRRRARAPA